MTCVIAYRARVSGHDGRWSSGFFGQILIDSEYRSCRTREVTHVRTNPRVPRS